MKPLRVYRGEDATAAPPSAAVPHWLDPDAPPPPSGKTPWLELLASIDWTLGPAAWLTPPALEAMLRREKFNPHRIADIIATIPPARIMAAIAYANERLAKGKITNRRPVLNDKGEPTGRTEPDLCGYITYLLNASTPIDVNRDRARDFFASRKAEFLAYLSIDHNVGRRAVAGSTG